MPDFDSIYLDTTFLRKSNWPELSKEFGELVLIAKNFRIELVIPELVEMEREEQWIRDLTDNRQKLDSTMRTRSQLLKAIALNVDAHSENQI
ncbi:MAG TPA: hypothetical protein VEV85_17210, partial [Bryobacteraceae bacterium]|nr:hypothetical protein [Bryobacteraceae bacterium]